MAPIGRTHALAFSREETGRLGMLSIVEVTPSRRDFALYATTQKQNLAVIASLRDAGKEDDLIALAQRFDDAEVAALALMMGEGRVAPQTVRSLSQQITAPLLRLDYVLGQNQIYYSRLHGFDAIVIPVDVVGAEETKQLLSVTSSLHMAAIVDVVDAAGLEIAVQLPHALIGFSPVDADGWCDVETTSSLAAGVPERRTAVVLAPVKDREGCDRLRTHVDAVVLSHLLAEADDVAALVAALSE